ncbi:MAG TPA: SRPBCC domain-containing protein [Solirubrobacterales bacterium]|nr:SRPBCC domain-containing protein [Solirubrobacterales bacterium]
MAAASELILRIRRTLPAPPSRVWGALTDPGELPKWWGPTGFTIPGVEFEPQVGESYLLAMQPPEGEVFHLHGSFREVEPPSRLSYTFVWEPPDPDDRETVVMLSLEERGDGTGLELTQGEFATDERLELHRGGWTESLDKLEALLS